MGISSIYFVTIKTEVVQFFQPNLSMKHRKHLINTSQGVVILVSLNSAKRFNAVFPVILLTTIYAILHSQDVETLPYLVIFQL